MVVVVAVMVVVVAVVVVLVVHRSKCSPVCVFYTKHYIDDVFWVDFYTGFQEHDLQSTYESVT